MLRCTALCANSRLVGDAQANGLIRAHGSQSADESSLLNHAFCPADTQVRDGATGPHKNESPPDFANQQIQIRTATPTTRGLAVFQGASGVRGSRRCLPRCAKPAFSTAASTGSFFLSERRGWLTRYPTASAAVDFIMLVCHAARYSAAVSMFALSAMSVDSDPFLQSCWGLVVEEQPFVRPSWNTSGTLCLAWIRDSRSSTLNPLMISSSRAVIGRGIHVCWCCANISNLSRSKWHAMAC